MHKHCTSSCPCSQLIHVIIMDPFHISPMLDLRQNKTKNSNYLYWQKAVSTKQLEQTKSYQTWYSSSSLDRRTACSTLRCRSISPKDKTSDFSWVITYSSPAETKKTCIVQTGLFSLDAKSYVNISIYIRCKSTTVYLPVRDQKL